MNVEERIQIFQAELLTENYAPATIVQKHITFGDPFAVNKEEYFLLKSKIAKNFLIHPSGVVMVGSGKLGFSIKPKNEFRPFRDEPLENKKQSDIDIAIISDRLFDSLWEDLYHFSITTTDPWNKLSGFRKYLFKGWIRPDLLPTSPGFLFGREWSEFFYELRRDLNTFKINAGIYRTWRFFETYQTNGVNNCKAHMALKGA